ncbi:hypothetical protein [Arthrobacter woluwensis]|uniref:hypothetical protein n=1 Tax=Arthrobacter woluwensis TaxID=156980 RepID=UPI0038006DF7
MNNKWDTSPLEKLAISGRDGLKALRELHTGLFPLGPDEHFSIRAHMRTFDCLQMSRLELSPIAFGGSSPYPAGVNRLLILFEGSVEITNAPIGSALPPSNYREVLGLSGERSYVFLPEPVPVWIVAEKGLKALEVTFHTSRMAPYVDLPETPAVLEIESEMSEVIASTLLGVATSETSADDESLRVFAENRIAEAFVLHANATATEDLATLRVRALHHISANYHNPELNPASIAGAIGAPTSSLLRAFKGRGGVMSAVRWKRAEVALNYLRASPRSSREEVARASGFGSARNLRRTLDLRLAPQQSHYRIALQQGVI